MSRARLGQNFLVNPGIVRAIVERAAPGPDAVVVEVGPGRGVLTAPLLERAGRVIALEIDGTLVDELERRFADEDGFQIRQLDAARTDWPGLLGETGDAELLLVANLPYEAATAILLRWLEASAASRRLHRAVVMVQLEVAQRLAAPPGTKARGSLGVLVQATHEVERVIDAGPGSFRPAPKVRSRVVELRRRAAPLLDLQSWRPGAEFIHAAFARRRKQLATALAGHASISRERWRELLVDLDLAVEVRAEQLEAEELLALGRSAGLL